MDLDDPWLLARAWLIAPMAIALVSMGLGAGIGALSDRPLGVLTAPAGYLAGMLFGTVVLRAGVDGDVVSWLLVVLAVAGAVSWLERRRERRVSGAAWCGAAGLVSYGIAMTPLVGSGHSGVLGYVLNNDPAIHLSVIELLRDSGARFGPVEPVSSFESVAFLVESGYPLGSYTWPLLASQVVGIDAFHVWTSSTAATMAMLSLVAVALLRLGGAPVAPAALAAPLVACGYFVFSFHAQGGLKEIATALAVYGTVAVGLTTLKEGLGWRNLLPPLIAGGSAVACFGIGAGAWLLPGTLVTLVIVGRAVRARRPSRRAITIAGVAAVVGLAAAAPTIVDSLAFVKQSEATLRNPHQLGNLLGPVPWREALGLWLAGDYRLQPPDEEVATNLLQAVAGLLALWGLLTAIRRRSLALPLALITGASGAVIISSRYSAYLDAKSYLVLAPAMTLAVVAGVIALCQKRAWVGGVAAAVVAVGVLVSDAYVYSEAWVTPEGRFEELAGIGTRFAGQGPMLVNEREQFGIYLLRDAGGWESWGTVFPSRGFRFGEVFPPAIPHTPDFDDYALSHYARFPLLLERRRPGGSRPPRSFEIVHETQHYRVWRREGPLPSVHVAAGDDYTGASALNCARSEVRALQRRARRDGLPIRVARRVGPRPRVVQQAWHWVRYTPSPFPSPVDMVTRRGGYAATRPSVPAGRYVVWVQGAFAPGIRLYVDERQVGEVRDDLGSPDSWHRAGEVSVAGGPVNVASVALDLPVWRVAGRHREVTGRVVFEPVDTAVRMSEIAPAELPSLCGKPVDWLELPPARAYAGWGWRTSAGAESRTARSRDSASLRALSSLESTSTGAPG